MRVALALRNRAVEFDVHDRRKKKRPDADRRARIWGGLFFFDVSQRQVDGAGRPGQAADGDAIDAGLRRWRARAPD